jgi:2,3-dihydroxyphenylpropionate 1,2-dioxygenase
MTTALVCASHSPLMYCYAKPPDDWDEIQAAFALQAERVREFDPELVFAFGADHFNGFFLKLMPAFCVGTQAHAVGDIGGFEGDVDVPSGIAAEAVDFMRANDVDPAVSSSMTIDHGFSQTISIVLGGLDARPTIPVFINCMAEPYVPFRRSRLMGEAIGCFAATTGKRVLFLGSGGMSHHPRRYYPELGDGPEEVTHWQLSGGDDKRSLSADEWIERLDVMHHEGAKMIARGERTPADMRLNEESDRKFLDVLLSGDLTRFDAWKPEALIESGGIGSMELQTWIAATAAHQAAGGAAPVLQHYSIAAELGIAVGIVSSGE